MLNFFTDKLRKVKNTNLFLAVIGIGSVPPPSCLIKKEKPLTVTQREEGKRGKKGERHLAGEMEFNDNNSKKARSPLLFCALWKECCILLTVLAGLDAILNQEKLKTLWYSWHMLSPSQNGAEFLNKKKIRGPILPTAKNTVGSCV
jgi:hypothetical protein